MNTPNNTGFSSEDVRKHFLYDPNTGVFYKSLQSGGKKIMGTIKKDGYVKLYFGGRQCSAHRIAWLYMTGKWPDLVIDHINGNPLDNRFENLREVTALGNAQNRVHVSKSKTLSKHVGVHYYKNVRSKHWTAQITVAGKRQYLGRFDTEQEAHEAYQQARAKVVIA